MPDLARSFIVLVIPAGNKSLHSCRPQYAGQACSGNGPVRCATVAAPFWVRGAVWPGKARCAFLYLLYFAFWLAGWSFRYLVIKQLAGKGQRSKGFFNFVERISADISGCCLMCGICLLSQFVFIQERGTQIFQRACPDSLYLLLCGGSFCS